MQTRTLERGPRRAATRRGTSHAAALLGGLAVAGGLAAAAFVFRPGTLLAKGEQEPVGSAARVAVHQRTIDALARLVRESRAVLGIVPEGPTPFTELVLWFDDSDADHAPDADEILVVSHSRIRRVLTLFRLPESADRPPPMSDAGSPEFCATFRAHRGVERWIFGVDGTEAIGISDLRVETLSPLDGETALLRITLTWATDSSDGPDSASVLTDVRTRRPGA